MGPIIFASVWCQEKDNFCLFIAPALKRLEDDKEEGSVGAWRPSSDLSFATGPGMFGKFLCLSGLRLQSLNQRGDKRRSGWEHELRKRGIKGVGSASWLCHTLAVHLNKLPNLPLSLSFLTPTNEDNNTYSQGCFRIKWGNKWTDGA